MLAAKYHLFSGGRPWVALLMVLLGLTRVVFNTQSRPQHAPSDADAAFSARLAGRWREVSDKHNRYEFPPGKILIRDQRTGGQREIEWHVVSDSGNTVTMETGARSSRRAPTPNRTPKFFGSGQFTVTHSSGTKQTFLRQL